MSLWKGDAARTIKLTIEYDGTNYCGWQMQHNGDSVQEKLSEAIKRATGQLPTLHGSGRTDAGVHARGQCASFITTSSIPAARFPLALNACLPEDISVVGATDEEKGFHARYSAIGKKYSYYLNLQPIRSPLRRHYSWHLRRSPDLSKMHLALNRFRGTHDFRFFRGSGSDVANTVRTIWTADMTVHDQCCCISFAGTGFLYKMVRMLVAAAVEVGLGKSELSHLDHRLAGNMEHDNHKLTAPPQGLFLDQVYYPKSQLREVVGLWIPDENGK